MTTIHTPLINERLINQIIVHAGVRPSFVSIDALPLQLHAQIVSEQGPEFNFAVDRPLWLAGALRGALLFQAGLAIAGLLSYELWSLAAR